MKISGWGNTRAVSAKVLSVSDLPQLASRLTQMPLATSVGIRGNGRSYGDQATAENIWSTRRLDHLLGFDPQAGILEVEAGVTLGEIQRMFIPRGWSLAVTPGTQFVTVGGAIANDVHGKNHHSYGTFGEHVLAITLLRTDGQILHCDSTQNAAMMRATIGGLGLTGLIGSATIQLRRVESAWITAEARPFGSIEEFWSHTQDAIGDEFTVSWLDIQSRGVRGVFNRGNLGGHQSNRPEPKLGQRSVPFTPPFGLINRLSARPMANAYNWLGLRTKGESLVHYQPFFYPLDGIQHWNRAYGPRGFFQHQAVIPKARAKQGLNELIQAVRASGETSVVSVLKTTGARKAPGLLTYPFEGVTLALDFANRGETTLTLMRKLDAITIEFGGRVNPSKDATMSRETFEASFGSALDLFQKYRDPQINTDQSKRLFES